MTVSSSTNRDDYAGNGSTTSFAVSFRFLENSHIKATLRDALSTETLQVETTDYTLTGAGGAGGGTLVMIVAPPTGTTLTIQRDVPATQETDYVENDEFPAESHEDALDKLTMLVQQQGEDSTRHIGFTDTVSDATGSAVELSQDATQRADTFIGFDTLGNIVTKTASVAGLVDQAQQDKRYGPIFATVAAMTAANPVSIDGVAVDITIGMTLRTQGYAAAGDGGGVKYFGVASQAVDGVGDHDAANGVSLILQHKGIIHSNWFNIPFDGTDAATNLQAWNDYIVADSAVGRLAKKSTFYTVKSQVNFSAPFYSEGAILKQNGFFNALAVFSGTGYEVEGVIFKGDTVDSTTQGAVSLCRVSSGAQIVFKRCQWKEIEGKTQDQYGIEFSAEDTDLEFVGCTFSDISATGANPPVEGSSPGFTGGIFMQLGSTPTIPSRLKVHNCVFEDIQTIRNPAYVGAVDTDYDADAIRLFVAQTDNETSPRHDIQITDNRCFNVQKRFVKNSGCDGVLVDGLQIEAFNTTDATRPNMLSIVSHQPAKNCVTTNIKAVGKFNYLFRFISADCEFTNINFDRRYVGYVHYAFGMEDRGALLERNITISNVVARGVERLFRSIDGTATGGGSAFYINRNLVVRDMDIGFIEPSEGGFTSATDHFFHLENLDGALFEDINIYSDDDALEITAEGVLLNRCQDVTFKNLKGSFTNKFIEVSDVSAGSIVTQNLTLDNCEVLREGSVDPDGVFIRTPSTAPNTRVIGGKYTIQSTIANLGHALIRLDGANCLEQGVEFLSQDFSTNAFLPFALSQPAGADHMVKDCSYNNSGTEAVTWMQASSTGMRIIGCNTNEAIVTISSVGDIFQSNSNPTGKTQIAGAGSFTVSGNNLQY